MERNAPAGGRQDAEAELLMDGQLRLVPLTARRFFPRLARNEDLLQCGLIGLWEASRSWSGRGEFSSYACHCILNNMRDYLRAESKALPPPVRQEREQADWYVEDKLIDELDMISRIHAAWPENSRERYVLLALSAGVSRQSVAAALGVQLHTVRRIAARAMERLMQDQKG